MLFLEGLEKRVIWERLFLKNKDKGNQTEYTETRKENKITINLNQACEPVLEAYGH